MLAKIPSFLFAQCAKLGFNGVIWLCLVCTHTRFILSYRAAQQSAVERISENARSVFGGMFARNPLLAQMKHSPNKRFCANIPRRDCLDRAEILRLAFVGSLRMTWNVCVNKTPRAVLFCAIIPSCLLNLPQNR